MRRTFLALLLAGLLGGALFGLSGCYATSVGVGVETGPPASYYDADGYYRGGHVFIDGHWAWTASGWYWYPGYWVAARPGYVYVQGYWDHWGGRWAYRPGVWARARNGHVWIGGRWTRHHPGYRHYDYRRHTWVRHSDRSYRGPARDHRTYRARPAVRDHRGSGRVREHRSYGREHRSHGRDHRRRR